MSVSSAPHATAEAFAKQALGNTVPLLVKPVIVNGYTGWYAQFADDSAVAYRPAGAAGRQTPENVMTIEIKMKNVVTLNKGRVLKLKLPGE
ncbi:MULTISPECIES: hypothetical protein [Acetobacter]|uniref:hypothetical protein n=1 Tax=Acetobacter TaxID=434 RepID=UPI0037704A2C